MKQRVLLKGGDAADLLHRISTVNIQKLVLNEATLGLILNPQGKIVSFFKLTKLNPVDSKPAFEVEFDGPFLEVLDQYTFAEKYEIEKLEAKNEKSITEHDRIRALFPAIGHEFNEDGATNPLEINLKHAIHENKGCYPGQEVIEKIISLGSPPRKLALLEGTTHATLPAILQDEAGVEAGTLTSQADGHALAILKRTHQKIGIALHIKNVSAKNEVFKVLKVQE